VNCVWLGTSSMQDINIIYSSNRSRTLIFGAVFVFLGVTMVATSKVDFHACFAHQACDPRSIIVYPSGFLLLPFGLIFFIMGIKGLPKLALSNDGITLSNMRGTRTVLWQDLGEFRPNTSNRQLIIAPAIGYSPDGRKVAQKPITIAAKFYAGKTLGFENELNEYRRIALEQSGPNPFDRLKSPDQVANQPDAPVENDNLRLSSVILRSLILVPIQWLAFLIASTLFLITFIAVHKLTGFNMKSASGILSLFYVLTSMYVGQYLATRKWRPNMLAMIVGSAAFISSVLGISTLVHHGGSRIVILLIHSITVPVGVYIGMRSKNAFRSGRPPTAQAPNTKRDGNEFESSEKKGKSRTVMANLWGSLLMLFVYFATSIAGLMVTVIATNIIKKEAGVIWNPLGYACTTILFFTSIFVGLLIVKKRWRPNLSAMLLGAMIFIWSIIRIRQHVNPYSNDGEFSLFYDTVCVPLGVLIGTWLAREAPQIKTNQQTT
jgi:hypothetical protein